MKTVIEMAREIADQCTRRTPPTWTHEFAMTCIASMVESARAEEREACAKVCEELLDRPSGYQGTWEGYGKFKTQMTGQECAAAIRARSNT